VIPRRERFSMLRKESSNAKESDPKEKKSFNDREKRS